MVALSMFAFVLACAMLLLCYVKVKTVKNENYALVAILFIMLGSFTLGVGITSDLYGGPGDTTWPQEAVNISILVGSLAALGLSALVSYLSPYVWGFAEYIPRNKSNLNSISIIMEIVGFIASILGIISFFLGR